MNLEDKTELYVGNVTPELLGKVIFSLYSIHRPSEMTIIQDDKLTKNLTRNYRIYMPKEEYELNLGIC